jgi:magnesium transporter
MKPLEALLRMFVELHPEDAARAFEMVKSDDALQLLRGLPVHVSVTLLERVNTVAAGRLLDRLETERICTLLSEMSPRSASVIVHQLQEERREEVLANIANDKSKSLRELAKYPADTAGAIMEPRVASLPIDLTVNEALNRIRKTPRDVLHYLYVTQRDGKLIGVMNMRDLLLALPRDPIEPLVRRNLVTAPDTMDREEVVNLMRERRFLALPVVDYDGRLVGVIKHDDALRAGQSEAFEDLQRMVGAGRDERALSPVSTVVKSRLPWLYVNLATAFLASAVVGLFEGLIEQIAALAVLLPVVAGQGGNTGSQSLAIVMRGLALREIIPGVKSRVVLKELAAGAINGIAIAVVTGLAVFIWRLAVGDTLASCSGLALVISLAMIVNMAAAALSGAAIPLLLKALGRDPAQSASIFLTTVTDIIGFGAFLGFALLFKPMLI